MSMTFYVLKVAKDTVYDIYDLICPQVAKDKDEMVEREFTRLLETTSCSLIR